MRMQNLGTKRQKRREKDWWWPPGRQLRGDDRYIIPRAKEADGSHQSVIAQQLSTATGRQVSLLTVARRLHKEGMFAHRPEPFLPLRSWPPTPPFTVVQRAQKLDSCQWSRVAFYGRDVDSVPETIINALLIWREIRTWFYTSNIKERHHYGGPGVLAWGGIMLNGRTELHIFDR
ncbi:transposable element Tcb2 transposase [Trichonephila clavipes]|nr:transposable element Tcb2 transposase [Trichonephila clavipes]